MTGEKCTDPETVPEESVLVPSQCSSNRSFKEALIIAKAEVKHLLSIKVKSIEWPSRKKRISWLNGTTALMVLDKSAANVYHLTSKTMPLTWIKGAGINVSRVFIKRSRKFLRTMNVLGNLNELGVITEASINHLLGFPLSGAINGTETRFSAKMLTKKFEFPILNGSVLFDTNIDVLGATSRNPICFESLLLPGSAHGSLYRDKPIVSQGYKSMIERSMGFQHFEPTEVPNRLPNVLYIKRLSGSHERGFSKLSERKVRRMLLKLSLPLKIANFGFLTFPRQIELLQWADIVFGVHGANLLNPSLFMKKGSILVELFPWHFLWSGYGNSTMALGGVYMGYMLDRQRRPLSHLTTSMCYLDKFCRSRYRDLRMMVMSKRESRTILQLLEQAKQLALDLINSKAKENNTLLWNIEDDLITGHFKYFNQTCKEFNRDKKMTWVGYYSVKTDEVKLCALNVTDIETLV